MSRKIEIRTLDESNVSFYKELTAGAVDYIGGDEALKIPTVYGAVEYISGIIASLPIKLYRYRDKKVEEVEDDYRLELLNGDTGDLVNSFNMRKQMTRDYLLFGNGYSYINRKWNSISSIHYIKPSDMSIHYNNDPIFKQGYIYVGGSRYFPMDFLKLVRNAPYGLKGKGIIDESEKILTVSYNTLNFENQLLKNGGGKKGFLVAKKKLASNVIDELKIAFKKFFSNSGESFVVLNEGLEYKDAGNTSVELQINENKKANSDEICKILGIPPTILTGNASSEDRINFFSTGLLPLITVWQEALNADLLLEEEKKEYYFILDTKTILKGDIVKTFTAYKIAIDAGILQPDEVRNEIDFEPLGLEFIKLGQSDVLYSVKNNKIYSANSNEIVDLKEMKGGGGGNES